MIIIGFSGKKRSGKNVSAKLFATQTSCQCYETSFARVLKQEVARACGVKESYIEEHKDNFRLILQGWGTDFKRKLVDDNYWIKKVDIDLYKQYTKSPDSVALLTDVRFPNEADYIKSCGGIIVRIERPEIQSDEHRSETALDNYKFDYTINNSSTLNNLASDIRMLIQSLKLPLK